MTIDLDTTDVEVYGRRKRGVAYNYQGQRCGRPRVASWAELEVTLAAACCLATKTPVPGRRGCRAARWPVCRPAWARSRCGPMVGTSRWG